MNSGVGLRLCLTIWTDVKRLSWWQFPGQKKRERPCPRALALQLAAALGLEIVFCMRQKKRARIFCKLVMQTGNVLCFICIFHLFCKGDLDINMPKVVAGWWNTASKQMNDAQSMRMKIPRSAAVCHMLEWCQSQLLNMHREAEEAKACRALGRLLICWHYCTQGCIISWCLFRSGPSVRVAPSEGGLT